MFTSFAMNRSHKLLYVLFAAGVAGVAVLDFTGFFASLPFRGEATAIASVVAGTLLITIRDYARRPATLRPLVSVTRPRLPARGTRRVEAIVERAA